MKHSAGYHSAKHVQSKLGGLTKSPLATQAELWDAFTAVANGIDPDAPWTELQAQYLRDFVQGMWIVAAIAEVKQ